ncbi:1-phosphofructokinase family hexose kinase [Mobiluncus mulieris]|uniref:1-phosphofructokinase family hexose kinase n=1 Tax=Mobiluncus mulieris TaxID=2052 RepID=UPI000E0E845D|nr:PfkB family carbohydrate kinase [Mobiluncus mulieris]
MRMPLRLAPHEARKDTQMSATPPQSTAAGTAPASVPLVTFTPNPAVDITYQVEQVVFGTSHRVERIHRRAGGKGLNTASVLALMGYPVVATGFFTSPDYVADLQRREAESPGRFQWRALEMPWPNRLSVAVVAEGDATLFNEAAPNYGELTAAEIAATWENVWERVLDCDWAPPGALVSINGSFPLSTPLGMVSRLVAGLRSRGCWVLVDTSGEYLVEAARAGADCLKPNVAELRSATGIHEVPAAARALLELGAGSLLVSAGREGLAYVCRDGGFETGEARESDKGEDFGQPLMNGTEKPASKAKPQVKAFWARPGRELSGNPTGAGDAAVAGFLAARAQSLGRQEALAQAVAWSAAAVPAAYAGVIETELVGELRREITYKTEDWS